MTEEMTHIVLEHLQAIHADLDEMKEMFDTANRRLACVETTIAEIGRNRSRNGEKLADLGIRVDKLDEELARIKRHLDIVD